MVTRAYNSEGIKMMFGGAGSWNEPALCLVSRRATGYRVDSPV
jgi:hypothetical protein